MGVQLRDQRAARIAAPGPAGRRRAQGNVAAGGVPAAMTTRTRACRNTRRICMASESNGGKEVEEGSVDDVGAEYIETGYAYVASWEEETALYQRL
ncbi:hypothetical protein EJB05_32242, partial [Eragrostis curvula]